MIDINEMIDLAAEKHILAHIIGEEQIVDLHPDCFYQEQHKRLFLELRKQHETGGGIAPFIIKDQVSLISDCVDFGYPKNIQNVINRLNLLFAKRQYLKTLTNAMAKINDVDVLETNKTISDTISDLSKINVQDNGIEKYDHHQSVKDWTQWVYDGKDSSDTLQGIQSGLTDLDLAINGWQRGKTYIIGGLKKTGKSRFAIFLISQWLRENRGGIIFSMEMKARQIHSCVMSSRLSIDTSKYGTKKINDEEKMKIVKNVPYYFNENIYICEKSGINPQYVRSVIQNRKSQGKVEFVVVDYIQRMKIHGMEYQRTKEVERCACDLADIGRDENVIMIILSQLSGEAEKLVLTKEKTHVPIYAFFKESQAIVEAADCVIALSDPNRGQEFNCEDKKDCKEIDAIIIQREGISDVSIKINAQLQYSIFRGAARQY
jgi:replicative DNA helicase